MSNQIMNKAAAALMPYKYAKKPADVNVTDITPDHGDRHDEQHANQRGR
ncbi:MAG: hypothetical protein U5K75_00330 [Ahrensia sp.]|nr:hypothetical protein [Ahrensia sp.]